MSRVLPGDVTMQLGRSATKSIGLRVGNAVLSLGISIVLARLLGAEGYGVYAFAFSIAMLLALPAQAGLPTLLVREIARFDVREEWGLIRGLLRRCNQAVGLLTVAILSAVVLAMLVSGRGIGQDTPTFLWALTLLPLVALGNLRGAALRGFRRIVAGQVPEYLIRPGLLLLFLLTLLLLSRLAPTIDVEPTPAVAMALHSAAAFCAYLGGVWLLQRGMPEATDRIEPEYRTRLWLHSVLPLTLLAGIEMINNQMDIVLLGLMSSARDVGVYRVAWQVSMPVLFMLTAVNLVVAPHFARAYQAGEQARLQRLATWSARVAAAFAAPVAAVLILFSGQILGLVFGREFATGATALGLLCVGQLFNVAAGSVGTLLNMTGHERDTVLGVTIAALVNLILNIALIPTFGIEGAAVATMTSMIVWNVVLFQRVRSRLGVLSWAFTGFK